MLNPTPEQGSNGNAESCAASLNGTSTIWSVMDRLSAPEFMHLLLAAHQAEDAFDMERDDQAFVDETA